MKNLFLDLKNNAKRLALGLLVVMVAIGFSAFKTSDETAKLTTIYYGYNDQTGNYELITGITGEPDPNKCIEGDEHCVVVADTDDDLDEALTPAQVTMLGLQPWSQSNPESQYDF